LLVLLLASVLLESHAAPVHSGTRTVRYYADESSYAQGEAPLGSFPELPTEHPPANFSAWPSSGNFDQEILLPFVSFARAAYCPQELVADWNWVACEPKVTDVQVYTDDKTDTQAYVAYFRGNIFKRSKVVVSFRGSQSMTNWMYNLQFGELAPYPHCVGCRVHGGFYQSWKSVEWDVTQQVKGLLANDTHAELYITGHSLGGALAVLCAAHLAYVDPVLYNQTALQVAGVFTFGEPRVGNLAFHNFYSQGAQVSWRLTHWKDPVPHMPPSLFGYHHIVNEVFFNNDSSSFKVCDDTGEDNSCSNSVAWDDVLFVSDHMVYMGHIITHCKS